jgi:hypothetical protein
MNKRLPEDRAPALDADEDKLIIGYLLSGNSAYDLCALYMNEMSLEQRQEILHVVGEQETELSGVKDCYRDVWANAVLDINKPLSE